VETVTLYSRLNKASMDIVDAALARTTVTFLSVSAVKAVLALLEGSAVGVGFHLEVGDLVQPVYDYVDFIWNMLLYALLLLGLYRLLLETGILGLGVQLVGAGLALWAFAVLTERSARWRRVARLCVMWGVIIALILPAALLATHHIGMRFTEPVRVKQEQRIEDLEVRLDRTRVAFLALRGQISLLSPIDSTQQLYVAMTALVVEAVQTIREALLVFVYYVVILMLDLLLFPFLGGFMLYKSVQFLVLRGDAAFGGTAGPMGEVGAPAPQHRV
jgi:hypothetical protein